MKYEFPRVARSRLKVINAESLETGDGKDSLPTEEERAWLDIMKATDPERERLRKKLAVCTFAEVIDYNKDVVTFIYDGVKYTVKKPVNGFRIARARESSIIDALEELNAQRQIVIGAVPIPKDFSGVDAEIVQLLAKIAENFFFVPYL
jgi:hypothetical protein